MDAKVKQDIISAWNEIDEVLQDLDLNNEDLISVIPTIKTRLERASALLGEHFTDDEANQELNSDIFVSDLCTIDDDIHHDEDTDISVP